MKLVDVASFGDFHSTVKQEVQSGALVYIYLYASNDPNTGQSWCPDCRNAFDLVKTEVGKLSNVSLILAATGNREQHRNPQNEYRVDTETKMTAVPTLINWQTGARLVEADCAVPAKLTAFLNQ